MEVKPGYKQTEVGVIPEDWEVRPMLSTVRVANGQIDPKVEPYRSMTLVAPDHIESGSGRLLKKETASDQHAISGKYLFAKGDIVYSKIRPYLRKATLANFDGLCSADMYPLRPAADVSAGFILAAVLGHHFSKYAESVSVRSGMPKINRAELAEYTIALPPTLAEQEAIAEALSDADALIESLEQLLVKKRLLKQGAMQELLRPKPSHEVQLLGNVSSLKGRIGWQGLKQTEFTANDYEPFLITGMNFKDGAIRWSEVYHISEARYEMAPEIQLRPNDVLMTKDGTIGKVLYIDAIPYPGKASLNSHLLLFRPIGARYNPRYLYYQLGSRRFKDFVELSKSGTTFFGLSQTAVAAYPVLLPPLAEQVRIATVLSDMDAEIAALETKLAKARQIKQGMMQELLTGRIRLI